MARVASLLIPFLMLAGPACAAQPVPSASQRFAAPGAKEVPDFRKHLLPMLGRIGCNGRACHGSFQGQGGFRLSLFGYDFETDYAALAGGETPRIDRQDPTASRILEKPTLTIPHKGGKRFEPNSWQYHLLEK